MFATGDALWKVTRNGPGGANAASVLATQDPHRYDEAIRNQTPITAKFDGTPIFAFLTHEDAEAFANGHPDRTVRQVKAYGEIVIPKRVLALKTGWRDVSARFWADAKAGNTDIAYWPTEEASRGTVAVFGHIVFV